MSVTRRAICVSAMALCVSAAHAQNALDYVATANGWNVSGWTDHSQITCGASTSPVITSRNYFSIYRQVFEPDVLFSHNDFLSFWSMDIGTSLQEGTTPSLTIDIDEKFHATYPESASISKSVNPKWNVIGLGTEECAYSPKCADKPGNMVMHAVAALMNNAKFLIVTAIYKGEQEVHRVDVSGFSVATEEINKCFSAIRRGLVHP